jgi:hypothetical protein
VWPDMSMRWALCLSVQPFASSFGPPQPYTSWLGSMRRGWAFLVVVRHSVSALGPTSRLWTPCCWSAWLLGSPLGCSTVHMVVRPSVWLFERPCGFSAVHVVVGFAMWSCGPPCRRCASRAVVEHRHRCWAVHVLVAPFASLGDPRRVPGMPRHVGVGRSGRQWGGGKKAKNGPRRKSWPVFVTHQLGLPFPGSPLVFLLHIPWWSEIAPAHIPLERGGVGVGGWPELGASGGDGR